MIDYEQRYNDALRRAKKLYEQRTITESLGWVFPELKDENERMKKAIMHVLYDNYTDAAVIEGVEIAEIATWLEKQGHMLHPDRVIEWLECEAFQGWAEPIDIRPIIRKFKKDFGL